MTTCCYLYVIYPNLSWYLYSGLPCCSSVLRSLKYCDLRVISCWSLQRTTLEQELGLAAYLLKTKQDGQLGPHARCDLSESDPEKLSTDDEELVVDGQYCQTRKHEVFTTTT